MGTNSEKLKELAIAMTPDWERDDKYQSFTIKVRTAAGKLYQKEVLIEHTNGVSHELKTLANYLEFMAQSFKKEGEK